MWEESGDEPELGNQRSINKKKTNFAYWILVE